MPKANELAAALHAHLCVCPKHGYTQGDGRWGTPYKQCKVDFEGRSYFIDEGDRDCSSSVCDVWQHAIANTQYAGRLDNATWTGNMQSVFTASGLFDWHPMSDGYIAQTGDIYLRHNWSNGTGHTALCQSAVPDMLSEFICNEFGGSLGGQVGDQTGRESRIIPYYNFPWDGILAYNHKADTPDLPKILAKYQDLDPDGWYVPYVKKVVEAGYMTGTDEKHWEPNDTLTRAQAVTALSRKQSWDCVKGKRILPFSDIGVWYTEPILEGVERGVVNTDNESFHPGRAASREQFATFIWRSCGSPEAKEYAEASGWARKAVGWCIENGIIKGLPRPKEAITRAEAAAMLTRF